MGRSRTLMPNIRQLDDGSWRADFRDPAGGRHFLPKRGLQRDGSLRGGYRSRDEAEAAGLEAIAQYRLAPAGRPDSVGEAIDLFLAQAVVSEKRRRQLRYLLSFVRATFADWPLEDLDADSLAAWQATLSEGSRYSIIGATRQWSKAAVGRGWLPQGDVVRAIGPNPQPDVKNDDRPFGSWAEVESIGPELSDLYVEWPVVMAGSGMRPEESWALEWADVDLEAGVLVIDKAWDGSRLVAPKNKKRAAPRSSKARREVGLFPEAVEALRRIPRRMLPGGGGFSPLVFPNSRGGYVDYRGWSGREWRPGLARAGMGRWINLEAFLRHPRIEPGDPLARELEALLAGAADGSVPLLDRAGRPRRRVWVARHEPYDLRHTFATWSLAAGVPARDCAEEMGTSLEMFEHHYGHAAREANPRNRARRGAYRPGVLEAPTGAAAVSVLPGPPPAPPVSASPPSPAPRLRPVGPLTDNGGGA